MLSFLIPLRFVYLILRFPHEKYLLPLNGQINYLRANNFINFYNTTGVISLTDHNFAIMYMHAPSIRITHVNGTYVECCKGEDNICMRKYIARFITSPMHFDYHYIHYRNEVIIRYCTQTKHRDTVNLYYTGGEEGGGVDGSWK